MPGELRKIDPPGRPNARQRQHQEACQLGKHMTNSLAAAQYRNPPRTIEARSEIIEQLLARAGLVVRHHVEHHRAFLVVQIWCNSEQESAVRRLSRQIAGLAARQGLVIITTKPANRLK